MTVQKRYIKARLANLIPDFIKPILRSLYRAFRSSWAYRKIKHHPKSCNELHNYWRHPWDKRNLPQSYLEGKARSQFLVKIMKRYVSTNAIILEIGCNVGRNLNYLFLADFRNLQGVEISEKAVRLLKQYFHEMANHTKIYRMPIEEIIREFKDCEFDTVFTMAVLEHIHEESEWILPEIVRIIKDFLITVEDESGISWRHFPRNYKKVFEPLGMKQIEEINCSDIDGLSRSFFARIFKKKI